MPSLRVTTPGEEPREHLLHKKVTSVGRSPDADVVVADPEVAPIHCQILFDGKTFTVLPAERDARVEVEGRRRRRHELAHGERVHIGRSELRFSIHDPSAGEARPAPDGRYRMLVDFATRLLGRYEIEPLLDAMMDAAVAVTGASKGFLVLFEEGAPQVRVARNLAGESLDAEVDQLSDTIVAQVVRERKPLLVRDAHAHEAYRDAASILKLNLLSVICVPLMDGDSLMGFVYLGSDQPAILFDESALELLTIFAAQASLIVKNALLVNALRLDRESLAARLEAMRFGRIIGACDAMKDIFRRVEKVATTDISVLITGETGTGKELIAKEIHERSARARGPFITINCGAIPENLLESELFGHVKGAFTGAVASTRGKFHAAGGGTLFLDEVGELPPVLQVKLLRAIQEKAVVRVGDSRPEPVDIRILAATNKDLAEEIRAGRFREDIYYRLNVVNIHLPPLRERGDDVLLIARYLLQRSATELGARVRGFTPDAAIAIRKYAWPGNIRQLENHIKKAVVLADKPLLSPDDLDLGPELLPPVKPLTQAKEEFQRRYINEVLARNDGNRTKTARDLGVDPRTIFRHLEREEELRRRRGA